MTRFVGGGALASCLALVGGLVGAACGGSGAGGAGGASTSASGVTASVSASANATASSTASGAGGLPDYVPTPADIGFQAVTKLPSGEQILLNDWNSAPNSVWSMKPDGGGLVEIFRAYRVWSMGVSHAADTIAFACGDPNQKAHFGIDIGDAIQHTFAYDVATETARLLAHGNINDECHTFSPDDKTLYVCRRYDFDAMGNSKNYRIGAIDVATTAFAWILPESANTATLYPAPTKDGLDLLYTDVPVPSGDRTIVKRSLGSSQESALKSQASAPVISPDGARYLFADYSSSGMGTLHAANLDGSGDVLVRDLKGTTSFRYSPDGARVAYLVFDNAKSCSHVEVVKADGSEASAPTRIYDCGTSGRFITDIAWIVAP